MNRLVCERVLSDKPHIAEQGTVVGWTHEGVYHEGTPDFCGDWAAFGLLLTHLRPRVPRLILDDDSATARVLGSDEKTYCNGYDEAIQRALVLAALKAYGVEV